MESSYGQLSKMEVEKRNRWEYLIIGACIVIWSVLPGYLSSYLALYGIGPAEATLLSISLVMVGISIVGMGLHVTSKLRIHISGPEVIEISGSNLDETIDVICQYWEKTGGKPQNLLVETKSHTFFSFGIIWITTLAVVTVLFPFKKNEYCIVATASMCVISLLCIVLHDIGPKRMIVSEIVLSFSTYCYYANLIAQLALVALVKLLLVFFSGMKPSQLNELISSMVPSVPKVLVISVVISAIFVQYYSLTRFHSNSSLFAGFLNILYGILSLSEISGTWIWEWQLLDFFGLASAFLALGLTLISRTKLSLETSSGLETLLVRSLIGIVVMPAILFFIIPWIFL